MLVENPSNSLEWMIFLAQKYASMFIKGTWLTLEIAVIGTLVGFVLDVYKRQVLQMHWNKEIWKS